jgi:hypothetical protein
MRIKIRYNEAVDAMKNKMETGWTESETGKECYIMRKRVRAGRMERAAGRRWK